MNTFTTKKGTKLAVMSLKGKPYMQVQQRMIWFEEENPEYVTNVQFLKIDDNETVAQVTVIIKGPNQMPIRQVTDVKREDKKAFQDHTEKAVTGALGRCLAQLGYGTQFAAADLDEGERIVDAPSSMAKPTLATVSAITTQAVSNGSPVVAEETPVPKKQGYRKPEYAKKTEADGDAF